MKLVNNKFSWGAVALVALLFRNIFMLAPDIINESLAADHDGRFISQCSRNVSVYFAADDFALRASKVGFYKHSRIASRRLGHTGPENMQAVQNNVYAIDCDNFNNRYDTPIGHSYFTDDGAGNIGAVFEHILQTLKTGRVSVANEANRTHILNPID